MHRNRKEVTLNGCTVRIRCVFENMIVNNCKHVKHFDNNQLVHRSCTNCLRIPALKISKLKAIKYFISLMKLLPFTSIYFYSTNICGVWYFWYSRIPSLKLYRSNCWSSFCFEHNYCLYKTSILTFAAFRCTSYWIFYSDALFYQKKHEFSSY